MHDRELLPGAGEQRDDGTVELLATACDRCGRRTFPPVAACPRCWARSGLRREPLPRNGTLHAFSVVHVRVNGIEPPYAVGYVDYPHGIRVCGRLLDHTGLRAGQPVEPVAGQLRPDGLRGWLFRAVTP